VLDALRRPLPLPAFLAGLLAAALVVAAYCVAYTSLAGRPEPAIQALAWAVANICPWLAAIEAGKRAPSRAGAAGVLAAAFTASLALGYLLNVRSEPLAFEAVRRLPGLLAAAGIVTLLRSPIARAAPQSREIPLLPHQIDWVRAAGNYVELRAAGRTIVHRSSISAAERDLVAHGFVRIHRSTLVRRDRIARVRPQDVVLTDGTHLKVGKRYRTTLQ
jgi:hypothetical protein